MRLVINSTVAIERHGAMLESEFNIGNPWLILEYMTKNIYSDIHRVIVQEIGCNARDAHREIGQKRRIRITLPNRFDSSIQFRDWGPGMNPQRIHEIFKCYGHSTKRNDDVQTGSFGIGGKVMWSYSDVFTISTTSLEDGILVKREYSAIKGEDRTLKLVEMGSPVTIDMDDASVPDDDKHTGTTVSMIVKQDDWTNFSLNAHKVTHFWNESEKPEIIGMEFPDFNKKQDDQFVGNNWRIVEDTDSRYDYPLAIVDGIPYPLEYHALNLGYSHELNRLMSGSTHLVVSFKTGELSLALSREKLQYDERTKKTIISRLEEVHTDIKNQMNDKMKDCKTLREAILFYNKMQEEFSIHNLVTSVEWNTIKIGNNSFPCRDGDTSCRSFSETRGDKLRSQDSYSFNVNKSSLVVINDMKETRPILRVKTLLANNTDINTVYVITPSEDPQKWKDYCDKVHMDLLEPLYLSKIDKMKVVRGPSKNHTVVKAYTWTGRDASHTSHNWNSCDVDLKNGAGVYVVVERYTPVGTTTYSLKHARLKLNLPNNMLHGIPERFVKHLGSNWVTLTQHVEGLMKAMESNIDFQAIANHDIIVDNKCPYAYENFTNLITDKTCELMKWINLTKDFSSRQDPRQSGWYEYHKLAEVITRGISLPSPNTEMKDLKDSCTTNYPILLNMRWSSNEEFHKDLALYVNTKNEVLTSQTQTV